MKPPAAVLALFMATVARAAEGPVTCEIVPPSKPVVVGEPIALQVRACNASGHALRLLRSTDDSEAGARLPLTTFLISGPALVPSELAARGCARRTPLHRRDVVALRPGECFDPFEGRPSVTMTTGRPTRPGRYEVRFRYATAADGFTLVEGDTPADRRALRDVPPVDVTCSIELEVISAERE